jgi:hypothetical protein
VERLAADGVSDGSTHTAAAPHSLVHRQRNLDALGIDVDDGREAGAAHRGSGGRQQ